MTATTTAAATQNYCGLRGIEFIEFASRKPEWLHELFTAFGFSKTKKHKNLSVDFYTQGEIHFLVNKDSGSFASRFTEAHGPCVSSMGWRVDNSKAAFDAALKRGAKPAEISDYTNIKGEKLYAIRGIGDSLIYFIDDFAKGACWDTMGFVTHDKPVNVDGKGFLLIDHLTNNVEQGEMKRWADFYKNIFGFTEIRYFDIRGAKTGLTSFALKSPDGSFCIPINEGTESKSQINEYLREYKGAGVQHIAFLSSDIIASLRKLKGTPIETLDMDDEYYAEVFNRVPNVTEDHKTLRELNILVDGDAEGYLLQIFTKNVIGPIFIEMIQRKNHLSFGEGNFGALFRSLERDQEKRGVL